MGPMTVLDPTRGVSAVRPFALAVITTTAGLLTFAAVPAHAQRASSSQGQAMLLETAGKCLEWVRDHLALDEINMYLEKVPVDASPETVRGSLYDFMLAEIRDVPAGSGGVIFTPWLHGNRCPFEDPHAAGMFFNLRLETGKREMIHAVLEGICHHLRWQLERPR